MSKRFVYLLGQRLVMPVACRTGWLPPVELSLDQRTSSAKWGYYEESEIKRATEIVRGYTSVSFQRLATLWQQVRYADKYRIPGALVECGVWRGGASAMMALAHMHAGSVPQRPIHLFDSFQGLPEPTLEADGEGAVQFAFGKSGGRLVSTGQCVAAMEDSRDLLLNKVKYPSELVNYHVGWFQDTVERDAPQVGSIAILRLDGDWYDSTRICLEHLYPLVAKNGVVVIDDYGSFEGCRAAVDEFLALQPGPVMLHHIDNVARYWIKPG